MTRLGHRQAAGGDHGGELVLAAGDGDAAGHGPGEVVIDGRGLAVDGQAGDAVGQRAGHRQQVVIARNIHQLVCIISLEGLVQGIIFPREQIPGVVGTEKPRQRAMVGLSSSITYCF